jgi:NAD(P)H-dependent nitrite reductase small subunit
MCYDCADEDALHDAREELAHGPKASGPKSFIYACKVSEIPQNGSRGKVIYAEKTELALFYLKDKIYAISNICPHQDSPLLSEGYIDKQALTVACPLHGWTYSIVTGKSVIGDGSVPSYEVKVLDDEVWVEEPIIEEKHYEIDLPEEPVDD